MDNAFLDERITKTKARIVVLEDALLDITTGLIHSYSLDTGQTRETVTKQNLFLMEKVIAGLYNLCATLEARRTGSGSTIVRPAW